MILLVSCLASFVIVLDVAMVNVGIPSIADALSFSSLDQQWFVNSYALAFSSVPLLAGRLADVFGHRRIFLVGLGVFTATGLACAASPSATVIECARAARGSVARSLLRPH